MASQWRKLTKTGNGIGRNGKGVRKRVYLRK
jgi:hypothetical protein